MKKLFILSAVFCLALSTTSAFADNFDALENITPAQKQRLTEVQTLYKPQLNAIDDKIMNYNSKIAQVKEDKYKTKEQSALLTSAYERNVESLKNQKNVLEAEMDKKYKAIMTDEQYKQYKAQQIAVDNAFTKFLQK